jgi:hypothetical protein
MVGALVAGAVFAAPSALASTVTYTTVQNPYSPCPPRYTAVQFRAADGEVNKLTVAGVPTGDEVVDLVGEVGAGIFGSGGGPPSCAPTTPLPDQLLFNDPGGRIHRGDGCHSGVSRPYLALCRMAPVTVDLGDRGDYLFLVEGLQTGLPDPVTVFAGPGDDHLRTINATADEIHCGTGNDVVSLADPFDVIDADCESVNVAL